MTALNQVFGLFSHGWPIVSMSQCFEHEGFRGHVGSTHAMMNFSQ